MFGVARISGNLRLSVRTRPLQPQLCRHGASRSAPGADNCILERAAGSTARGVLFPMPKCRLRGNVIHPGA
eukprot:2198594-Pyramimonas_sp.AAC.1